MPQSDLRSKSRGDLGKLFDNWVTKYFETWPFAEEPCGTVTEYRIRRYGRSKEAVAEKSKDFDLKFTRQNKRGSRFSFVKLFRPI